MKAAVFHAPGKPLSIKDMAVPDPGPGQLLIKIHRCGICGSDLTMTDPASPVSFAPDCVPGHEFSGEVVAIGKGADGGFAPGDRVTAIPVAGCGVCEACDVHDPYGCANCSYLMGGFGEYALVDARLTVRLPQSLSFEDGALVEQLACGSQALRLSGIRSGSRVLVLGAGAIGLSAIYWARRAGCTSIVAAAPSRRRQSLAETMGATGFLSTGDDLAAEAAEALGGAPDVVFECAGKPGAISSALACVATRGTVVSSGMCFAHDNFVPGFATMKQVRLQFSMAYELEDFKTSVTALDAGHVEPRTMVTRSVSLMELPQVLEDLRRGGDDCKVMVKPQN